MTASGPLSSSPETASSIEQALKHLKLHTSDPELHGRLDRVLATLR
jgi:hypothetical protein